MPTNITSTTPPQTPAAAQTSAAAQTPAVVQATLEKKDYSTAGRGYGEFFWRIQWKLQNSVAVDTIIVQEVNVSCGIKKPQLNGTAILGNPVNHNVTAYWNSCGRKWANSLKWPPELYTG